MRIRAVNVLRRVVALLLTAAVLATASCSGGQDPSGQPAGDGQVAPADAASAPAGGDADPTAPVPVAEILKFESQTLDGAAFSGASLAGRHTVLWFWAPWCATCAGQAASIRDMFAEYADEVAIVGVAGLGKESEMREFLDDFEIAGVTTLNDQSGEVWRRFEVVEQSTYVFLDRSGSITHRGWLDSLQFETRVAAVAAA